MPVRPGQLIRKRLPWVPPSEVRSLRHIEACTSEAVGRYVARRGTARALRSTAGLAKGSSPVRTAGTRRPESGRARGARDLNRAGIGPESAEWPRPYVQMDIARAIMFAPLPLSGTTRLRHFASSPSRCFVIAVRHREGIQSYPVTGGGAHRRTGSTGQRRRGRLPRPGRTDRSGMVTARPLSVQGVVHFGGICSIAAGPSPRCA
jgi:hypothetical protein